MKLIYTFTVVENVETLDYYQDGNTPVTSIQEAAKLEQLWLEAGEADPMEVLCNAESYTVVVKGEENDA